MNGSGGYSEQSLKYPLRALAERRLGSAIAGRGKKGFSVPLHEWFRQKEMISLLRNAVDGMKDITPLLNSRYVDRLIEEHAAGRKNHQTRLWSLLMLCSWWQTNQPGIEH